MKIGKIFDSGEGLLKWKLLYGVDYQFINTLSLFKETTHPHSCK